MREAGVDPEKLLDTYIRSINVCTQGRPSDLRVGLHMCRGNYKVNIIHQYIEAPALTILVVLGFTFLRRGLRPNSGESVRRTGRRHAIRKPIFVSQKSVP